MITFVCPHCRKPSEFDETPSGVVTCPACGRGLQLPKPSPPGAAPSATAPSPAIPDEDEAKLRAELPDAFFPGTEALGRPRFRVERQVLDHSAYRPALALVLCCIPCLIGVIAPGVYLLPRLLGMLLVAAFVTGAVVFVQHQRRKAKVYALAWTGGFVHFDGREFHVWRWADVAALNAQAIDQRTLVLFVETDRLLTKSYRLRHRSGAEYQFWSTQGARAAQFGLQVERETLRLMMPDVVARLNAGQSVPFGPFELRVGGVVYRGNFTAWADLQPAHFDRGRLLLEGAGPAGGTASVLLGQIDNSHVFLRLLERNVGFAQDA
jgi:Family of unknown function (DUF6585)